jgi:hypothetical protein
VIPYPDSTPFKACEALKQRNMLKNCADAHKPILVELLFTDFPSNACKTALFAFAF